MADVAQVDEGLLVGLRSFKTDQEGRGRKVEVVYGADLATCPVRAGGAWLARRVSPKARRSVPSTGTAAWASAASRTSPSPSSSSATWSAWDGRVGTYAGTPSDGASLPPRPKGGASKRAIMRSPGHTSTETVRGYIEEGELFTDPASGHLGL